MTKKECKNILSQRTPLDKILKIYDCGDCFDAIGTAGGDVLQYRVVKKDGTIYER